MNKIKVIAFDADDTLWVNEPYFQQAEKQFCDLLEDFLPRHDISKELFRIEMANLSDYGYGVKAFMLSMTEAAIKISDGRIPNEIIKKIIALGKELLHQPIELLDGVQDILEALKGNYRLVMATKGDLLDQERKLYKSGLENYFHHTEILSEKKEPNYEKLIKHLDVEPHEFLMIGNSLKSDVIPVLNLGGWGFHVPYHTTWEHEKIDIKIENDKFKHLNTITEILPFLQ